MMFDADLSEEWVGAASWAVELAKQDAALTGEVFTITLHDVTTEMRRSDMRGAVCTLPLSPEPGSPWAPRIDRVDKQLGYEPGNIQIVCAAVYMWLGSWGVEALAALAQAMVAS